MPHAFDDPEQLFTSGVVDGVLIAVPHVHHYPLAKAALDAGLHVMLEKPMVLEAAHAWDLVDTARSAGLHLMVGYTYQFTRAAAQVAELVGSGRIGELLHVSGLFASMVESYYRGQPEDYADVFKFPVTGPAASTYADPAIAGGGQGQTQITHTMGMVLWATGRRVTEVSAFMGNRDLAVDLVDAIAYRLDNGAVGTMGSTGSLRPGQPSQQEFRYYGSDGYVLQDLLAGTVVAHFNDGSTRGARTTHRGRDLPGRGDQPGIRRSDRRTRRQPGTGGSGCPCRRVPRGRLPFGRQRRRTGADR